MRWLWLGFDTGVNDAVDSQDREGDDVTNPGDCVTGGPCQRGVS